MGMSWAEFLLLILTGWTVVGALGITLSLARGERAKATRHLGWIAAVWMLYLAALATVSLTARRQEVLLGQDQCFHQVCFAVIEARAVPDYLTRPGEHVLQVAIRITNRSHEKPVGDAGVQAYLVDSQGRRWQQIPGLEGVRLSTAVAPLASVTSEPVFKVANDATDLVLVLHHKNRFPGLLILGGPESLLHPQIVARLRP